MSDKKRRVEVNIPPTNRNKEGFKYIGYFMTLGNTNSYDEKTKTTSTVTVAFIEDPKGYIRKINPTNVRFIKQGEQLDYDFNKI